MISPNNGYSWLSDVHLANNYFEWNNDASHERMFYASGDNSIPYLIENNTFRREGRGYQVSGHFLYISNSSNIRVRNNVFYDNEQTTNYRFEFSTNTILIVDLLTTDTS